MKRILSIDGGGIRGLIPAIVCRGLENFAGVPLWTLFDLMVGTSTGGIIALGLSMKKPAAELVDIYLKEGGGIFSDPRTRMSTFRGSKYSGIQLQNILRSHFHNLKLSEASTEVLITTYDIKGRIPYLISRSSAKSGSLEDYLVRDVALASCAAPTYFPPVNLGDRTLIDGGLVANNPALLALAEAKRLWPREEVLVLSLGTGQLARPILDETARMWGRIQWAEPIIDCFFDGTAKATDEALRQLVAPHRFKRFQYGLNDLSEKLDGVSKHNLASLVQAGETILKDRESDLRQILEELALPRTRTGLEDDLQKTVERISIAVDKSMSVGAGSRIFQFAIQRKLDELSQDLSHWTRGSIRISSDDEGRFLVDLYAKAKETVFSTRLKVFTGTFKGSALPNEILRAHKDSSAKTTRVFVFERKEDVNAFDFREMVRQTDAGINVRVLIDLEKRVEDFTIIDNSAIGVTDFVSPHAAAARWTFADKAAIDNYVETMRWIASSSIPFNDYANGNNIRRRIWSRHELVSVNEDNVSMYQKMSRVAFGKEAADDERVLFVQSAAGGIYLLQRHGVGDTEPVGILALFAVSNSGFRRLEEDQLTGSAITPEHLHCHGDGHAIAYYLGSIVGLDNESKAALVDALESSIQELAKQGVESIFARPVTDDGVRLVSRLGFLASGELPIVMGRVCRLRL